MESLDQIAESEKIMTERIKRISDMNYGVLSIGGSSQASYYVLPRVCAEYKKRFPQIEVNIDAGNVGSATNLTEKIRKHALDLVISYEYNSSIYERTKLFDEQLADNGNDYLTVECRFCDRVYKFTKEDLIG